MSTSVDASWLRGLRRLRTRGHKPGDTYGRLLLKTFGLPPGLARWAQALGTYHSPLIDLPLTMRREQLRLWDASPAIESASASWIHLAVGSVAHQDADPDEADRRLQLAGLGLKRCTVQATHEHALFLARRRSDEGHRDEATAMLAGLAEDEMDAAYRARWLDQRAYLAARGWRTDVGCLDRAATLWEKIPDAGSFFVRFRRHHGLAWVRWRQGQVEVARMHAATAVRAAGDGGLRRLRASALGLQARLEPELADELRARRLAILHALD